MRKGKVIYQDKKKAEKRKNGGKKSAKKTEKTQKADMTKKEEVSE